MSEQEITNFQQKWEQLSEWGAQKPEEWAKNEIENNERLLEGIEAHVLPFPFFHMHSLSPFPPFLTFNKLANKFFLFSESNPPASPSPTGAPTQKM
jgi:hypothetical protein